MSFALSTLPFFSHSSFLSQWTDLGHQFITEYRKSTPNKVQVIDLFLVFSVLLGLLQIAYIVLAGQYPFNSFVSSLFSTAGFFVLVVCLRLQLLHPKDFGGISPENAFASFVVCNLLLFFAVTTFIG